MDLGNYKKYNKGCAVGAAAFELSKTFDEIIAVDFSSGFIQVAN